MNEKRASVRVHRFTVKAATAFFTTSARFSSPERAAPFLSISKFDGYLFYSTVASYERHPTQATGRDR